MIRKNIIGLLLVLLSSGMYFTPAHGQFSEIGFGIGGMTYTGDVVRPYDITLNRPGLQVFYRANLNKAIALRANITYSMIEGSDAKPIDPFAEKRGVQFSGFFPEAAVLFEYNFLDIVTDERPMNKVIPYFMAGVGVSYHAFNASNIEDTVLVTTILSVSPEGPNSFQLVIPFGGGVKFLASRKWTLNLEFGVRKTFFDYLDFVSEGNTQVKNYKYGNQYDNDWYYFTSLTVSYKFFTIPCPYSPYNRR